MPYNFFLVNTFSVYKPKNIFSGEPFPILALIRTLYLGPLSDHIIF